MQASNSCLIRSRITNVTYSINRNYPTSRKIGPHLHHARLYPGISRRLGCRCIQVGVEVAALDVEAAFSRPFHGDVGVLTRAPAVELCPQVFCSRTPHRGGAHGCRRTALAPGLGYHRVARRRSLPSLRRTGGGLSQAEVVAQSSQNWGEA